MPEFDPIWRLTFITGFLGALTTFFSFSAEVGRPDAAAALRLVAGVASLHLVGLLTLTAAGIWTTQQFLGRL